MKKYLLALAIVAMFIGGAVSVSAEQDFAARDLPNQH